MCLGEGDVGGDGGGGGVRLLLPPVGDVVLPVEEVVEVEAVGGRTLARAGGVLPPEAGAVVGVGELQDADQREGAAGAGEVRVRCGTGRSRTVPAGPWRPRLPRTRTCCQPWPVALAFCDRIVGLVLDQIAVDGSITKTPGGGEVA